MLKKINFNDLKQSYKRVDKKKKKEFFLISCFKNKLNSKDGEKGEGKNYNNRKRAN